MRDLLNVGTALGGGGGGGEVARVDQRYAALRCTIVDVTADSNVRFAADCLRLL
jgi:hypothetical protein